jgi:hypothetical protein
MNNMARPKLFIIDEVEYLPAAVVNGLVIKSHVGAPDSAECATDKTSTLIHFD